MLETERQVSSDREMVPMPETERKVKRFTILGQAPPPIQASHGTLHDRFITESKEIVFLYFISFIYTPIWYKIKHIIQNTQQLTLICEQVLRETLYKYKLSRGTDDIELRRVYTYTLHSGHGNYLQYILSGGSRGLLPS